jgi:uncharacterized protein YndB with AHSA1/START domain
MPTPPSRQAAFERPPIRHATVVRSELNHTFETFVRTIGQWWPAKPYSIGQARVVDAIFESRVGGRVFEIWDDGHEVDWGRVTAWEPPHRFAMTWEILPAITDVEVRFRALGPAVTRVELAHSGWERLTEEQLAAATSVPGGYAEGWRQILEALRIAVEAGTPTHPTDPKET